MTTPTTSWNENTPAGSDDISQGDNRIRELKTQVREVVDVDHKFESSGQDADNGKHNKVSLIETADLGSGAEGLPILGAQTVNGKAELVFTDEDDNDVQLTSGGEVLIGDLENDTFLQSDDNAGTGSVDIVKANASDDIELGDGFILPEGTAPTTAVNQGGLFVKNDGTQTELYFKEEDDGDEVKITEGGEVVSKALGSYASKSEGTDYEATTDGFVIAMCVYNSGSPTIAKIEGYTDSATTPTTMVTADTAGLEGSIEQFGSITFPVKKGDYYRVDENVIAGSGSFTTTINFVPLS